MNSFQTWIKHGILALLINLIRIKFRIFGPSLKLVPTDCLLPEVWLEFADFNVTLINKILEFLVGNRQILVTVHYTLKFFIAIRQPTLFAEAFSGAKVATVPINHSLDWIGHCACHFLICLL